MEMMWDDLIKVVIEVGYVLLQKLMVEDNGVGVEVNEYVSGFHISFGFMLLSLTFDHGS